MPLIFCYFDDSPGLQSNVCGPDRFTCQLDLDCIPLDHMCDGVFQCIDKSDEDVSLCQGRLINNGQAFSIILTLF